MPDIVYQVCSNHPQRMASARCLECSRFFCKECITEHSGRVLCTACLTKTVSVVSGKRSRLAVLLQGLQWVVGVWLLWVFFYCFGRLLLRIPSAFHEGALWR